MSSTEVNEGDLNKYGNEDVTYENLPDTLEEAHSRLFRAETLLDDLVRAFEIAQACGSLEVIKSFVEQSNDYLANKIKIVRGETKDIKIVTVVDDLSDEASESEN